MATRSICGFDDPVQFLTVRVISLCGTVDSPVLDEMVGFIPGFFRARLEDHNGKSSHVLHQPKTGDIGFTIADIHHVFERNGPILHLDELVNFPVVAQVVCPLVNPKQELSLGREIDGESWPAGYAVLVEHEL